MSQKHDEVYAYIKKQIVKGELLPGVALDLGEISETLKVSRSPLRDALIRLEAEGFLTIYPRSKVVLNRLDIDDVHYLYETIGTLETTLILRNLDSYTKEITDSLLELHYSMVNALNNDNVQKYEDFHHKFHAVFLEIKPNKFVERILDPIKTRLWELPKKNFHMEWLKMACDEHYNLIQHIINKDKDSIHNEIKTKHWDFYYNKKFIQSTYFNVQED